MSTFMQPKVPAITSLGGSGENGRNCFLINTGEGYVLLDCGVKRECTAGGVGLYPALTKDIVPRIRAVFLSHAHEDHTAALPYLFSLGYEGPVYATAETCDMVPAFLHKWTAYVQKKDGTVPYAMAHMDAVRASLRPLPLGKTKMCGMEVVLGRSGHVLGGVWIALAIAGQRVLFTGDMSLSSRLLAYDTPPQCHVAIVNCAYAGRRTCQEMQYAAFDAHVRQTLARGGRVLLPVPANGRGSEMLLHAMRTYDGAKIYAEQSIVQALHKLMGLTAWTHGDASGVDENCAVDEDCVVAVQDASDMVDAQRRGQPALFFVTDGMLTAPNGLAVLEAMQRDENNCVLITGHVAQGTAGAGVLDASYRAERGMRLQAEKLILKVHLDDEDAMRVISMCGARRVLLFHADAHACAPLMESLTAQGVKAACMQYPHWL